METNSIATKQPRMNLVDQENLRSGNISKGDSNHLHLFRFKSIILLVLGVICTTITLAQIPTALIEMCNEDPVIDGIVDDVWASANEYNISKPFSLETPTLGALGETTWKGLWNRKGIFLLIKVADNVFSLPFDKPEIWFDCNYERKDGLGASDANSGHYCFAPVPVKGQLSGGQFPDTLSNGIQSSYFVTDPSYLVEYFIPFSKLLDKDGFKVDVTGPIGFDISIIDNDINPPLLNRMVWANAGEINENQYNMDGAGEIVLLFTSVYPPEKITLSPGSITKDKGTLQMTAHLLPELSTNVKLIWTVTNGTGKASINNTGLVTAISNGTVNVKVNVVNLPFVEASTTVTISGQTIDKDDLWNDYNLIKNWNFTTDLTNWNYELDESLSGQTAPIVSDGYVSMTTSLAPNGSTRSYTLNQTGLKAEANVPYILKFKSWSSAPRTNSLVFEDSPENHYARYGSTFSDSWSLDGRSEWVYETTTEPSWFTLHVVFDHMVPTTVQKIQWNLSTANATTYIDSILLVKEIEGEPPLPNTSYLTLSTNDISLTETEASSTVNITSNTDWEVRSDQTWVTVTPFIGTGNQTLTLAIEPNPLITSRIATITVYSTRLEPQTITVTQQSTTGIDPIAEVPKLSISPNPTSGKLKLVFNQIPKGGSYLTVTDVTGKTILKQLIQNKEEWIDLSGNTPGVYFIKTNLNSLKVQKVILK